MFRPLKILVPFVSALVFTSVFSLAVLADDNPATGWQENDGKWYYYDEQGEMATGWQLIGSNWYYFYSSGKMAHDTTVGVYTINAGGKIEEAKGSNDDFDWELSPDGELTVYCENDTLTVCGVLDDQIITKATSLKIMKSDDSQYSAFAIGDNAFNNFTSLESVIISDSVTYIGECAFEGCTSLESISIPSSVTSIGEEPFYGCDNLKTISVSEDISKEAFEKNMYAGTGIESIVIPSSVTSFKYPTSSS